MTNNYFRNLENKFQGYHTRLKELHFSAPSYSIHKIIDEFDSEFMEFEDSVMEDAQGIFGTFEPGDLEPVLPKSLEIENLLSEMRGTLADMKDELDAKMYTGIINLVDDFWHTLNKNLYLIKIAKKTV